MTEIRSEPGHARQRRLAALLATSRLIPVVALDRAEDAVPLARALLAGGLRLVEVTLRTPAALEAARRIADEVPGLALGIGTVLTPGDLRRAEEAGARFAVSPGATLDLLDAAARGGLPFIPGIATASELMTALAHGFETVKFFPAASLGGTAALKALAGPFPQARFCPTGGVDEADAAAWLALPNVAAVGGSWLAPAAEVRAGSWEAITDRARRALARIGAAAR